MAHYSALNNLDLKRGDIVAVEASPGHDIGVVSLTGDLVARQMRRTGFNPYNGEYKKIYRKAKPYDIEKWQEAIALEHETMIASRQIAADMGLNMKIGDVEYQGDKIKAIFYYIADERVDFRELIKVFAERFHIRIEMKQIGARQEAGRIGGLGACGRELCCASWMSSFSSVTTGAARVQDISLNPQKLAGQCSKLKCCMMYEYDTYVDARKEFPRLREPLQAAEGEWFCVKSDVLAGTMTFSSSKDAMANVTTLPVSRVREIMALNRQGKKVERLQDADDIRPEIEEPTYRSEEDSITRFDQAKRRKRGVGLKRAFAFDMQAVCSGFLYALETGANFIRSGNYKKVVVVGAEKMSSIINYADRATCPIFGDGGAAVMLEPTTEDFGIMDAVLRTDGKGLPFLHIKAGGSICTPSYYTLDNQMHYIYQEGRTVFKYAVSNMADACESIIARNHLSKENIDWVIPHQANQRIITAVTQRLEVPVEKVMVNIERYGNTSAGTLPLCLWDFEDKFKKGDNLILTAFGAGFAWGAIYVKWGYDGKKR